MTGAEPGQGATGIVSALSLTPPSVPIGVPEWSPEILELHGFLKRIHPAGRLPSRRDFDPTDVPKLLPHLWLIELGDGIHDHKYRLAGSNVAASVGMDYTGKRLVDVHPNLAERPAAYAFIGEVQESRLPHWYNGAPRASHAENVVRIQNLIAPLAEDGETVDSLVGIAIMVKLLFRRRTGRAAWARIRQRPDQRASAHTPGRTHTLVSMAWIGSACK